MKFAFFLSFSSQNLQFFNDPLTKFPVFSRFSDEIFRLSNDPLTKFAFFLPTNDEIDFSFPSSGDHLLKFAFICSNFRTKITTGTCTQNVLNLYLKYKKASAFLYLKVEKTLTWRKIGSVFICVGNWAGCINKIYTIARSSWQKRGDTVTKRTTSYRKLSVTSS